MKVCRILQSLALSFAILAMSALTARAAVPVTTNLLVNLNGDSTSNFLASGDAVPAVQVWKDLAEDGSDASQQDFGQVAVGKQPGLLANTAVPNSASTGISYNVLDFDRSRPTPANNSNSNSSSDVLRGKDGATTRPALYGDLFTPGKDAAYEAANTPTGISWFAVFRSTDTETINNNNNLPPGSGSGGTTSRWGNQGIIDSSYISVTNWWGTFVTDGADADTQVNVLNHIRTNVGDEFDNPNESGGSGTSANTTINTWYMVANSYDPTTGAFRTVMSTPDGSGGVTTLVDLTSIDSAFINANGIGDATEHVAVTLGELSHATLTGSNNDWAFDGLMAEVLVYNAALGATDFDSVAAYLNSKYFVGGLNPGDHNEDGVVDSADYVTWRKDPASHGGDPDGYTAWRENFGVGSGAGSGLEAGSVPEPGSLILAALAVLGTIGVFRSRHLDLQRVRRMSA